MARNYEYHNINEMGRPSSFIDNVARPRFSCELRLINDTNPILLENFNKCARWIADNCPRLNGVFDCRHNPYYWVRLVVENGKAYLECGSHGWGFDIALSLQETAVHSRGSCQRNSYAFRNVQFFRNDRLEVFLSQWSCIKSAIIAKNIIQSRCFSESFEA